MGFKSFFTKNGGMRAVRVNHRRKVAAGELNKELKTLCKAEGSCKSRLLFSLGYKQTLSHCFHIVI